jgi:transcriptional regulator with XRE-family HTH domain
MSDLERLIDGVCSVVPEVRAELDAPDPGTEGRWYVLLERDGHEVDVEWRPGRGFGVTSSEEEPGYGEGPDETYDDAAQATARVAYLLAFRRRTSPRRVVLGQVREILGVSQAELARRLGVQQAAVSKVERREDPSLTSIWRYIDALGGTTEGLLARFGDEEYVVVPFLLAREVQDQIELIGRTTATPEERRRAAEFLRRALPGIRAVGRALQMPDLAERADQAIRTAEAA